MCLPHFESFDGLRCREGATGVILSFSPRCSKEFPFAKKRTLA